MRREVFSSLLVLMLVSTSLLALDPMDDGGTVGDQTNDLAEVEDGGPSAEALEMMVGIDAFFTENLGQLGDLDVRYYAQGSGMNVHFGPQGPSYLIRSGDGTWDPIDVRFFGADPVEPIGIEGLSHRSNFILGNVREKWVTNAQNFEEVLYREVWDDIDIRYYMLDGKLKYDLIIRPGGDPSKVAFEFAGVTDLGLDDVTGDLIITTPNTMVRDDAPIGYQALNGGDVVVPVSYERFREDLIGFDVGPYSEDALLVIDPGLEFATFMGGSNYENRTVISLDDVGNILVATQTVSTDFPVTTGVYDNDANGVTDIVVAKLDPTGSTLLFSTYIGGSGQDWLDDIWWSDGSIIVTGYTGSTDFPLTTNALDKMNENASRDVFLLRISGDGVDLQYSSYFGGDNFEYYMGSCVDDAGNLFISGSTSSTDLPTTPDAYYPVQDGSGRLFAVKFAPSLDTISYCTYINASTDIFVYDVQPDALGNLYIGGITIDPSIGWEGGGFDTTYQGTGYDGFICKLNATGSRIINWTYLGGNSLDYIEDIDLRTDGSVVVVGGSLSFDFPLTPNALDTTVSTFSDGIVTNLESDLSKLRFSTFFGGMGGNYIHKSVMDKQNDVVYCIGQSNSTNLATTVGAFDTVVRGWYDTFIVGIDLDNPAIEYCTYIGGNDADAPNDILLDGSGNLIISGISNSTDFPFTEGTYNQNLTGEWDCYIANIDPTPCGPPKIAPTGVVIQNGNEHVTLNWDKPELEDGRVIKHQIYRGDTPDDLSPIGEDKSQLNQYTDNTVKAGLYYYQVAAVNSAGEGARSGVFEANPYGRPREILNLTATTGNGAITLRWEPPSGLENADLEYNIKRGPTRDELKVVGVNWPSTEFIDDDVEIGTFYYYAVVAINEHGVGIISEPIRIRPVNTPSQPASFNVISGDGKVIIRWGIPSDDGGSMIRGYRIYRGTTPDNMQLLTSLTSFELTYTDLNVTNGHAYIYYMVAFSAVGDGRVSASLDAQPFGLPTEPLDPIALPDVTSVHLSWSAPVSDRGSSIFRYLVLWGDAAGDLSNTLTLGNVTSYSHTGLTNGVTYYYQVLAVNEAGEGPGTVEVHATPMGPPSGVGDLEATLIRSGIKLTWAEPLDLGGATSATLKVLRDTNDDPQTVLVEISGVTEYIDSSVVIGSTYFYRILVVTDFGEGPIDQPVEVSVLGVPGQVIGLSFEIGNGMVDLEWQALSEDGGSPILSYIISRGVFETALTEIGRVDVSVLGYTDDTAENGKSYFYGVHAINAIGKGLVSDLVSAKPLGPPGSPGVLEAKTKDGAIVLTWTSPTAGGNADVTGYKVFRGESEVDMVEIAELGLVNTYTDDGIEEDRDYYYKVVATSDSGDSELSRLAKSRVKSAEEEPGFGAMILIIAVTLISVNLLIRRRTEMM